MINYADIAKVSSKSALLKLIDKLYQGDIDQFVREISQTANQLLQGNLKKAEQYAVKIGLLARHLPQKQRLMIQSVDARISHGIGKTQIALRKYNRIVGQLIKSRDFKGAANTRLGLMDVYTYLGRHKEALETGKKALSYFKRKDDTASVARTLTNIGNIYHRQDDNKMALKAYDQAREIFTPEGGIPLAIVDFNRANIFTNLGMLDKAEEFYKSTADICRKNSLELYAAKADYSLAYIYFLSDKYSDALVSFENALTVFQQMGDQKAAAVTQLDLAEINIHLSQFGSAVMTSDEVIKSFDCFGMRYEQAKASYFAADALLNLGDHQEALKYLRSTENLFKKENNKLWLGMTSLAKCRYHLNTGRFKTASSMAEKARGLFNQSGDYRHGIDSQILLADAWLRIGKNSKAFHQCEKLLKDKLASYQKYAVFAILGNYYQNQDEYRKALKYYKLAIAVVEKMMLSLYPDEIQMFFALGKQDTYLAAIECLLKLGQVEESFLQNSRALSILNRRRIPEKVMRKKVPQKYLETRTRLRASLKKLIRTPEQGQRSTMGPSVMHQTEHQLWTNERKIRSYLYKTIVSGQGKYNLKHDISVNLARDELLINYIATSSDTGAFVITNSDKEYITCPVPTSRLEATVREMHFLMENSVYMPSGSMASTEMINHYLERLYDWLITPLNLSGKWDKLFLVLDGIYAQIPFMALKEPNGNYLKDKFKIRIIVNPDDLEYRETQKSGWESYNNAIFAPVNSGLPMIASESRSIKRIFKKANQFNGDLASCAKLTQALTDASGFIHIATHASRSSENPLFSKILMSDGPFFPFDLFGKEINAQLVSLSGCQTAAPGIYYGNSFSLAKAFYQGGVKNVLASLWTVSDKISMYFMVEFYRALKHKPDIFSAYYMAIDKTMKINENPAFWSPFILLGI
jgi:CHAT domain-containing protein/predicted negative regulator of RcsB-dependent stress response